MTSTEAEATLRLHRETPHIAVLTIDNPPANTFTWRSRNDFKQILDELDRDTAIRCLVITGTGNAFTAGANLREDQAMASEQLRGFAGDFDRILHGIEDFRAPVIGAINGATVGGGLEFAMSCDIRIASENAFFVAAGVNVGLIANFWRLIRIVGLGPAKEILLTGDRYSAEQALRWGLVTEVHPPGQLMDAALAKAERIATRAPLSVETTKQCANLAPGMPREAARRLQLDKFTAMFHTADHQEAMNAFFERRIGNYQRR